MFSVTVCPTLATYLPPLAIHRRPITRGDSPTVRCIQKFWQQSWAPAPYYPSLRGGSNYAWAGALTADDRPLGGGLIIPSINTQVSTYLGSQGGLASADALHIVFGGGNDLAALLNNGFDSVTGALAAQLAAANILNSVTTLIAAGADAILVPNLPDLGLTPLYQGNSANANALTQEFNRALTAGLFDLEEVIEFDTFAFLNSVINDFAESSAPCLTSTTLCDKPQDYLFFDDFHPTTRFYAGYAGALQLTIAQSQGVPEPRTLFLFGLGLLCLLRRGQHVTRLPIQSSLNSTPYPR